MFFLGKKAVEAKLVGPNLVAAFHNAHPPLIWNFDLVRNHSFTIAMQGEEGDWELGITSPKGEFYPIAHFASRDDAEEAMARVQKLLMKSRRSKWMGFIKGLVIVIVICAALFMFGVYALSHLASGMGMNMGSGMGGGLGGMAGMGNAGMVAPAMPAAPQVPVKTPMGIPVPADEVLQAPQ